MSDLKFNWNGIDNNFSTINQESKELEIVPREDWGAVFPKFMHPLQFDAPKVYTAYTKTCMCLDKQYCRRLMQILQERHMKKARKPDIKYNFLIGSDGRVYEGRGWGISPDLPFGYHHENKTSYYIAFVGDFTAFPVPSKMWWHLEDLIKLGVQQTYISKSYTTEFIKRTSST